MWISYGLSPAFPSKNAPLNIGHSLYVYHSAFGSGEQNDAFILPLDMTLPN